MLFASMIDSMNTALKKWLLVHFALQINRFCLVCARQTLLSIQFEAQCVRSFAFIHDAMPSKKIFNIDVRSILIYSAQRYVSYKFIFFDAEAFFALSSKPCEKH